MKNKLLDYLKKNQETLDDLDDAMKVIVRDMEKNILINLKRLALEKSQLGFADQLYKAESWVKIQEQTYKKSSTILTKFFKKFQKEITDLKKMYPESTFQNSALVWQWEQYEKFINKDLDILKLISGSKSDVLGIARLSQMQVITDINDTIVKTVEKSLGAPISHLQARLTTSNSAVSNKIRQSFYRSVKTINQKKYIYAGVSDGKTRTFCRRHLGLIKTSTEWKHIYNGQIGTAWEYVGGWNCRHVILLVSEGWTKKEVREFERVFNYKQEL